MATENPTQSALEMQDCNSEEVKNVTANDCSLTNETPLAEVDQTVDNQTPSDDAGVETPTQPTVISEQTDDLNGEVEEQSEEAVLEESVVEVDIEVAPKDISVESVAVSEQADNLSDEVVVSNEQASQEVVSGINSFEGANKEQIITTLGGMLNERAIHSLRKDVESAKMIFSRLHRDEAEVERAAFIEAGGVEEEFVASVDSLDIQFKELLKEYRRLRDEYMSNLDAVKEVNLKVKLQIIEDLKELINSDETLNLTFTKFRELQQNWKDTGLVPQQNMKGLWETYNHHVENFYGFIKINKELRDLDLKRNCEQKLIFCEQAESLVLESSVLDAFLKLQKLHDQWREVGPVANEYKESLWDRFKSASARINKSHQEYFDGLKEEQTKNLDLKCELCVVAEGLHSQSHATRKDWNKASDELLEIQKTWKTIGFAPKKDNNRIYERFRMACDKFFEAKREFYAGVKGDMEHNMELKTEICALAESLSDSEDWKKTTDELIALQAKWKGVGAVSRRHSDQIWKRFRAACDTFFERKIAHFANVDGEYEVNLANKRALLAEMNAADISESGYAAIKEFQHRWSDIGFVPIKQKDAIQKEYKEVADKLFATLRGSERDSSSNRFKDKISSMKGTGDKRLRSERERLYVKVRQLEQDIALLENNIGFFAKSKNVDALVANVQSKIERAKVELAEAIKKVKMIDSE